MKLQTLAFCHLFPVWQIGKWHIYYQKVETWQRIYKMKRGQTFPWKLRQCRLKRALISEKNKREKRKRKGMLTTKVRSIILRHIQNQHRFDTWKHLWNIYTSHIAEACFVHNICTPLNMFFIESTWKKLAQYNTHPGVEYYPKIWSLLIARKIIPIMLKK